MTPEAAAWVRANVLLPYARDEVHSRALIEHCPCQWGPCGHCDSGRHEQCTARRMPPSVRPETYLVRRNGSVVAEVWRLGKPCVWLCPCGCRQDRNAEPAQDRSGNWVLFEMAA